jgi:hypothetical protein
MSGRALRRLPVLALARYLGIGYKHHVPTLQSPQDGVSRRGSLNGTERREEGPSDRGGAVADVEVWLEGMESVILDSAEESKRFA